MQKVSQGSARQMKSTDFSEILKEAKINKDPTIRIFAASIEDINKELEVKRKSHIISRKMKMMNCPLIGQV